MSHFATFESLSLSDLQDFVTRGQEENLHLDFKLVKDASFNSGDDKKILRVRSLDLLTPVAA